MNWTTLITDYWAQTAVIIGAIGYLLKIILDHRYKRREIWYSIYSQKKIEYLLKFQEQYYKAESEILGFISVCKTLKTDPSGYEETDVLKIVMTYRSGGQLLSQLKLFLKKTQMEILRHQHTEVGKYLQSSIDLLKDRNNGIDNSTAFSKLYEAMLATIQDGDRKLAEFKL